MRLNDDVHQGLKLKTIKDGVSIQGFVEEIIKTYLEDDISASELLSKIKK